MVGEMYDYMIGIVIVGIIFISAVAAVPAINYVNLLHVDQQQLRNTALNVFNAMLLGTGSPPDWGSRFPFDQNNVEAFGLDLSEESSMYMLDTDKLQRLDQDSPWHMEYLYIRDLLRLKDYGFCLRIFRPFTVEHDLKILDEETVWFAVNVTRNEDGRPIPNAQVSVTVLVTARKPDQLDEPIIIVTQPNTYFTDCLGRCEGNESIVLEPPYLIETAIAVMEITVAGISTTVVALEDTWAKKVMKINTFGDTVTLSIRNESYKTMSARKILNIFAYDFDELTKMREGDVKEDKITHGEGWVSLEFTFPGIKAMDPALLLFTVSVTLGNETGGRKPVIVVGPFSHWEPSMVLSFGPDPRQVTGVVIELRRYVVISDMTYIAELTLWKE